MAVPILIWLCWRLLNIHNILVFLVYMVYNCKQMIDQVRRIYLHIVHFQFPLIILYLHHPSSDLDCVPFKVQFDIVFVDLRTSSQKFCIGKIENGSSSCIANSSIPNKKRPTMAVAGMRARHCKFPRDDAIAVLSAKESYIAEGSRSIHRLRNRPVCLVSVEV